MTTLQTQEFTCLVCRKTFRTQVCVSTNAHGGRRTDFHDRASGTQPLPFLIVTCGSCGYTARPGVFTDADEMLRVDFGCRAFVWNALAPQIAEDKPIDASLRYEFAARIAAFQDRDAEVIADLWLRAAWSCVEEADVEAERYYRLKAVDCYVHALTAYDAVDAERRAMLVYLVAELWRRIGYQDRAKRWFSMVADAIIDPVSQKWILELAHQQATSPREWMS